MCRPEPVSPDSPYADPGPKRLTAALSPSECQPPATDGSGRRPPSRAVARGGRPEHAERRPAGCPRWPSSSHRYRSDQRISMVLRIAAHGVPQGGAPHGRQPARTTEDRGASTGGIGEGSGDAAIGCLPYPAAAAHASNPGAARPGTASDDGRNSPMAIGPTRSRSPGSAGQPARKRSGSPGPKTAGIACVDRGRRSDAAAVRGGVRIARTRDRRGPDRPTAARGRDDAGNRPVRGVRAGTPSAGPAGADRRRPVTRRCRRDPCCPERAAARTGAADPSAPGP